MTMYERRWHERTINGVRYQFEMQLDTEVSLYRINLYQQSFDGTWNTNFGSWQEGPKEDTAEDTLVAFADRWEAATKVRQEVR